MVTGVKDKQKLSVVVVTKNEANKISRCLESVRWADEIIVIDDQSVDNTVEICKKYTDKIIVQRLENDFVHQRNTGIDQARGDWILQMDADEVVTEGLRKEIRNILQSNPQMCGYKFKRKNYLLGKPLMHGGWHHDLLRLFRKDQGRYLGRGAHELIEVKGKIGYIRADMEHYPCEDISQFSAKQNFYTTLEAQRLLRERGLLSEQEIKYQMTGKPLKIFWKTYIKKRGFLDGMRGLVYCVFNAYIHSLKWIKYWELCKVKKTEPQKI